MNERYNKNYMSGKIRNKCEKCGEEFEAYNHLKYCSMECLGFSADDIIELDGEKRSLREWCDFYHTRYHTIRYRVLTGRWTLEEAIKEAPKEWSGQSKEREYETYCNMLTRCNNPNSSDYLNYGGRGIKVCNRWLGRDGYQHFKKDMGLKPSVEYSIDRIDVNGNYCPENCRWATIKEQANNKVTTQYLTFNGVKKPITYWCEEFGISKYTVRHRLERGWSIEEALLIEVKPAPNKITEDDVQKALVQWLELNGYKFWHTANEVWTPSWSQKIRSKKMGVKPGVPDLTILIPKETGTITLYLEVKTDTGVMSDSQKEWSSILSEVDGVEFRCGKGLDECISIIEAVQLGTDRILERYDWNKIKENRLKRAKNPQNKRKSSKIQKNDLPY